MKPLVVVVAIAALAGCRTRLPVDRLPAEASAVAVSAEASPAESGVVARWLHAANAEADAPQGRSRYHLEITPDRLRDLVRPQPDTGRRGAFRGFYFESSVCLPHR